MIRWLIFISIVLFVDFYAFQSIKTVTKNKIAISFYWLMSIGVFSHVIYQLIIFNNTKGLNQNIMLAFGILILFTLPKLIAILVLGSEDIYRVFKSVFNFFSPSTKEFFPNRREFVSKLALSLAAIPFTSVLYGMVKGRYNYQVVNHTLYFTDLPESFHGFKLTHISDIHCGSFDNEEKIAYGINLINEQESDVILFTGDLLNNTADEMNP